MTSPNDAPVNEHAATSSAPDCQEDTSPMQEENIATADDPVDQTSELSAGLDTAHAEAPVEGGTEDLTADTTEAAPVSPENDEAPSETASPDDTTEAQDEQDAPSPLTEEAPQASFLKQPPPHKPKHLLALIVFVLMLCFGAGFLGWHEVRSFLDTPPEAPGQSLVVDIEPGMTLAQVSALLEEKRIITDAQRFQLLARWEDKGRSLQAGRFLLNTGWTPEKVLDMLVSGRSLLYRLTLREGLPWWAVADILEKEGFCKAEDFAKVIHDPAFLQHWSIPFDSAEGFLFPETYLLPRPREMDMEAARSTANRLVETFWKEAEKVWPQGRPAPSDLKRLVTLASIVEKETSVPEERARVAGVYSNRLRIRMLLQADPTVIYGLGPEFSGRLLYRHLEDSKNPYNTYRHPGLPPGPICSFGSAALKAALEPEQHKFLYFVATGKGREHKFSTSLSEHNRAVQEYRAAIRKKNK